MPQHLSESLFQTPGALRVHRNQLRLSQTRLAVLSDVPRWKIAQYELGDVKGEGKLSDSEKARICAAFQSEVARLKNFTFGETTAVGVDAA
jgi:predicted transcriptional regulator